MADDGEAAEGDGLEYEVMGDGAFVSDYTGTDPVVHIPSTTTVNDTSYDVTGIMSGAFGPGVVGVYIPSSVIMIDSSAFYNCTDLEFVSIEGTPEVMSTSFPFGNHFYLRAPDSIVLAEQVTYDRLTDNQVAVWFMSSSAPEGVDTCRLVISQNGDSVQIPSDLNVQGYDIAETIDGEQIPEDYTLSSDVIVDLTYAIQKFTVSFVSDGTTVQTGEFDYGTVIEVPTEAPVREQTDQYTYTFSGWQGYEEGMTVTQDVIFEALFTETIRQYTVTFESEGETVQESVLDYGAVIVPPEEIPTKESVDGVDYTFTGWDGYIEGMTVSGDHRFKASFTSNQHEYTVTFVSEGEIVSVTTYRYGDTIMLPDDPVKESSDGNDYTFTGWEGYTENMTVSGDHTFTATFEAVPQQTPDDGGSDTMWIIIVVVIIIVVLVVLFLLRKHF